MHQPWLKLILESQWARVTDVMNSAQVTLVKGDLRGIEVLVLYQNSTI